MNVQAFSNIDVFQHFEVPSVLAVMIRTQGASYRPIGAAMRFFADDTSIGTLSSGCIEADIKRNAQEVLQSAKCKVLRYGNGSPFLDIQLPCGGALEIALIPNPDAAVLMQITQTLQGRKPVTLGLDVKSGNLFISDRVETGSHDECFHFRYTPESRFIVFGKGPEAAMFASLVQTLGYSNLLLSPDRATLQMADGPCETRLQIQTPRYLNDIKVDKWSAIVLFFHDHKWEPEILHAALNTDAFYIGAQGSLRTRLERENAVIKLGVPVNAVARIKGPIGLIPSARDPKTLAVSVLAEVLKEHKDAV